MNGFQVTFYTGESRRHGHTLVHEWLMATAKSLDIHGVTMTAGIEGVGRDGKLHSTQFVELADTPLEVTMAMTEAQSQALFEVLEREQANVFYIKTPVEFGVIGGSAP